MCEEIETKQHLQDLRKKPHRGDTMVEMIKIRPKKAPSGQQFNKVRIFN